MKQNRNVLSFLLPASLFVILGVIAWFQFKWVRDLQRQEQWRLESLLTKSTVRLANTIQEELVLLPSLVKTRENQPEEVAERVRTGIEFWTAHASVPELFSAVYLIVTGDTPYTGVWNGSGFTVPDETVKNDIEKVIEPVFLEETDSIISLYLTLPDGRSLIVSSVSITSPDYYLVTELNGAVFTDILMPEIAEDIFPQSDLYRFRIIDRYTGRPIYTSEENYDDRTFAKPDLSWPLPALSTFKPQMAAASDRGFSMERFPENPQQIFSILRAYSRKRPVNEQDAIAEHLTGIPGPAGRFMENEQPQFVLEVVHKDGSLLIASRKATAVNAVTSLGVIVLLGFGLAVLLHNLRKAQNLAESQQEFIATVTHELKTPLAVISSAAQNLAAGIITNEEKVRKYGTMIEKENVRLRSSIEYFLLYANINTLSRLSCTDCDLVQIIGDVLAGTEMLRTKLEFVTEISVPGTPVSIRCDRTAFYSVIQNMVSNVLKHARDGKYLGISFSVELADSSRYKKHGYRIVSQKTRPSGKNSANLCRVAVLKISDHGRGIPRSEQKHIFKPFVRGASAVDNQIEGSGIGLNLTKRIVTLHRGTIVLENSSLHGSTFTITIPVLGTVMGNNP